jgi:hypothetical protein
MLNELPSLPAGVIGLEVSGELDKRIAVVTDVEWMVTGTEWFGWMMPGEIKHFPIADRDAAITWAAG